VISHRPYLAGRDFCCNLRTFFPIGAESVRFSGAGANATRTSVGVGTIPSGGYRE
jgi:hypothetical protein